MIEALAALEEARELGVVLLAGPEGIEVEWDEGDAAHAKLLERLKRHKEELRRLLVVEADGEVAVRLPDPSRGVVYVMDYKFSCTHQRPTQPLPAWCHAWCQEHDPAWTYCNRGDRAEVEREDDAPTEEAQQTLW
jgi:hypothetical protein